MSQAVCHCRNCQRQSGTAFSVLLVVPTVALLVQGQTTVYQDRGDSGAEVARHFCNHCGSSLFTALPSRPDVRFIKAGTLDDPSFMAPKLHVWCASAWHSTVIPDDATVFLWGPSKGV
ncbi:GFA family protein [Novosphingobium aquae]|uniref:GFA family protein n=1 Tax=Novosphingobium aquae TaxID=3133435 RepID=A0ABU8S916_9SPHN